MPDITDEYAIGSQAVRRLSKLVEESTRATGDSVKYFIEPTPGVLDKAKNKRHHIIFGRRGSGKSSLLHKVAADLTISRTPCMDDARGAREKLDISAKRSGAAMYSAFERSRYGCWP